MKILLRLVSCSSLFVNVAFGIGLALPVNALAAGYTFTNIDVSVAITSPGGINDAGQIVGTYLGVSSHGYIDNGGVVTTIDVPGSLGTGFTAISNSGLIVGTYRSAPGQFHAFLDTAGAFTNIDVPGGNQTVPYGINNTGQIVGTYADGPIDNPLSTRSFIYSGGVFTPIYVAGSTITLAAGINDAGQIVGGFSDTAGGAHGFLYSGGIFTTIDVPGAYVTWAAGISSTGQIVGLFSDPRGTHGFLDSGGVFTTFNVPGALYTEPTGINAGGQIVGTNSNATGSPHAFLATPILSPTPEPEVYATLLAGLGLLSFVVRRRKLINA